MYCNNYIKLFGSKRQLEWVINDYYWTDKDHKIKKRLCYYQKFSIFSPGCQVSETKKKNNEKLSLTVLQTLETCFKHKLHLFQIFDVVPVFLLCWSTFCRFPITLLLYSEESQSESQESPSRAWQNDNDCSLSTAEHINHHLNFLSLLSHANNQKKGFQIKLTSIACRILLIEQPPENKNISLLLVVNISLFIYP